MAPCKKTSPPKTENKKPAASTATPSKKGSDSEKCSFIVPLNTPSAGQGEATKTTRAQVTIVNKSSSASGLAFYLHLDPVRNASTWTDYIVSREICKRTGFFDGLCFHNTFYNLHHNSTPVMNK